MGSVPLFWQGSWSQDRPIGLAPQLHVPATFVERRAGRDIALKAILQLGVPWG
jgi:hypothetical protein